MRPRPPLSGLRQGFALLAVLWSIGIMTVTVLGLIRFVSVELDEDTALAKRFQARLLAQSGLAVALHPLVEENDPVLKREVRPLQSYEAVIRNEGGRLPINQLLAKKQTEILLRLWTQWGLPLQEAQALNDCLLDWVDPDDLALLNGAERATYLERKLTMLPPNKLLRDLEELPNVLGFAAVTKLKPDWRNYFTLWSDGKLDLNEAPADLIAAVCNVSSSQAGTFVQRRDPDGIRGSPDDYRYKDLTDARSNLGLFAEEFKKVESWVTVKGANVRIESRGIVDRTVLSLVVVTKKDGNNPVYFLWQEF